MHQGTIVHSNVNWHTIKRLYLQGCFKPHTPEPDQQHANGSKLSIESIEQYLNPIIQQIVQYYEQNIHNLQDKCQRSIESIKKRIEDLEIKFNVYKQENKLKYQRVKTIDSEPIKISPFLLEDPTRSKSFIHIEEEQEEQQESLLEQNQFDISFSKNTNKVHLQTPETLKRGSQKIMRLETISKNQLTDGLSHHFSEKRYRLETKASSLFGEQSRTLKDQVENLRRLIGLAHGIEVNQLGQHYKKMHYNLEQTVKIVPSAQSKNAHQHLINENQQLRKIIQSYKRQLLTAEGQLFQIKDLLLNCGQTEQ